MYIPKLMRLSAAYWSSVNTMIDSCFDGWLLSGEGGLGFFF
jgi:hypothetical protein